MLRRSFLLRGGAPPSSPLCRRPLTAIAPCTALVPRSPTTAYSGYAGAIAATSAAPALVLPMILSARRLQSHAAAALASDADNSAQVCQPRSAPSPPSPAAPLDVLITCWNPIQNRIGSLRALQIIGIDIDTTNTYRVAVRDAKLLAAWFKKRLLTRAQTPSPQRDSGGDGVGSDLSVAGGKKDPLRKWERALLQAFQDKHDIGALMQQEQEQAASASAVQDAPAVADGNGSGDVLSPLDAAIAAHVTATIDAAYDNLVGSSSSSSSSTANGGNGVKESRRCKTHVEPDVLAFEELSAEQQHVLRLVERGYNVVLGGTAGSGKSVLLSSLHAHLLRRGLKVMMTGTTGVSGVQIGGCTFHSAVGVTSLNGGGGSAGGGGGAWDVAELRGVDVVIVDEVSMLTAHLLETFNRNAKEARMSSAPYGGIQVVLCGDFMQLVHDSGPGTQCVFECDTFKRDFVHVALTQAQRQKCEQFRSALMQLREGKFPRAYFEQCGALLPAPPHPLVEPDATFLFPKRAAADAVNEIRLQHLQGKEERVFMPMRGSVFLQGNFSSACVVNVVPSKMPVAAFSTHKIIDAVTQRCGLTAHSTIVSWVARSGLAPQIVFRLRHGGAKPEATEAAWKQAMTDALHDACGGEEGCSISFETGDLADLLPLDVATSLGAETGKHGSGAATAVRLRVGCRIMINRNLSRDVVNGTLAEVVGFEEVNVDKFPFAGAKSSLLHLWRTRGGMAVAKSWGVLPVVRIKIKKALPPTPAEKQQQEQQAAETEAATAPPADAPPADGGTATSTAADPAVAVAVTEPTATAAVEPRAAPSPPAHHEEYREYQLPPMFAIEGGAAAGNMGYAVSNFYMPCQLGYALTVHKAQGLTISDSKLFVDLRDLTYRCNHLVYVAASRVRRVEQLFICGFQPRHLTVHKGALDFTKKLPDVDTVMQSMERGEVPPPTAAWLRKPAQMMGANAAAAADSAAAAAAVAVAPEQTPAVEEKQQQAQEQTEPVAAMEASHEAAAQQVAEPAAAQSE